MTSPESELIAYTSKYLNNDNSDDSLTKLLDYDTMRKYFIVHDRKIWRYLAFDTSSNYITYRNRIPPEERLHHEVIWGDMAQRIKFDIDASENEINAIPNKDIKLFPLIETSVVFESTHKKAEAVIWHISHTIVETFIEEYGSDIPYHPTTESDILITDSSGPEKISFHIVLIHFKLKNNIECKYFCNKVCEKLPITYEDIIDKQVNKGVQTFRIQGSLSRGRMRCKNIAQISRIVDDGFIQDPEDGDEIVNGKCDYTKEMKAGGYLSMENLEKIIAIVTDRWPEFAKFRDERGGFLNFDSTGPSSCNICNKVHDRDNWLMIHYECNGTSGPIKFSYGCRRANNDNTTMRKFHTINATPYNRTEALRKIIKMVEERVSDPHRVFAKYNNGFIEIKGINESSIGQLPMEHKSIFIRAGMKMGKTKALKEWIKKLDEEAERKSINTGKPLEDFISSICILSFRITFTMEMKSKFEGFKVYSELKKNINSRIAKRLIVQVESLHRIDGIYDYIILDESESIIGQFASNNVRNLPIADARFQALIARAKKVICMDAYLGERTIEVVKAIRGPEDMLIYHNYYQNAKDYHYEIGMYKENDYLLRKLSQTLNSKCYTRSTKGFVLHRKGLPSELSKIILSYDNSRYRYKNIAIIANSKSDLDAIHEYITIHHPDIKESDMQKYSATTDASVKEEHMKDVHKYWRKRIILYTPTVTAGISFELKWFDKIFAVFKNDSCDVLSCTQMLGRIRNLNDKHIIVALSVKNLNCSTSIDSIKRDIERNRHNLIKEMPNNIRINPVYDNRTDQIDYKVDDTHPYWYIWAYNTLMANKSKRRFIEHFCECIALTGASISVFNNEESDLYKELKTIKKKHRVQAASAIAFSKLPSLE